MNRQFSEVVPLIHFHPSFFFLSLCLWTSQLCFSLQTSKPLYWQSISVSLLPARMWEWLSVLLVCLPLLYLSLLLLKLLLCIWTQAHPSDGEHVWNITTAYQVQLGSLGIHSVLTNMNLGCDWRKGHRECWWQMSDGTSGSGIQNKSKSFELVVVVLVGIVVAAAVL